MKTFCLIICLLMLILSLQVVYAQQVPTEDFVKPETPLEEALTMVLIPAGEFQMGSNDSEAHDDEKPVHTVYTDAFYIDKYEVTVGEYKAFIQATGYPAPNWNEIAEDSPTDQHPIIHVSWHDAMAYAKWTGKRLPTEAEWEKAARGGLIGQKYTWGNTVDPSKGNYNRNAGGTTVVGSYPPNRYGVYDMAGNAWEWCLDAYNSDFYASAPGENPVAGGTVEDIVSNFAGVKTDRVLRGIAWTDTAKPVLVATRVGRDPMETRRLYGFRCVKAATPRISEEPDVIFQLVERLQFADGTAVKSIAKDDIDALRDRPIRLGPNDHLDGVTLTNEKDEDIQVRTCREYDAALKRGYYANTNFDAQMSMWFKHQCGLLNALERAAAPRQSYISNPKVGITNLELMPFSVFPYASDEEIKSGATFQTKIKNGELRVVEKNQNTLTTEEIDTGQFLQEVVRADFNDDGIEDIFLFEYHYAIRGTFGSGGVIVLTRKSADGKFEVVRPANPTQSSGHPYWFD